MHVKSFCHVDINEINIVVMQTTNALLALQGVEYTQSTCDSTCRHVKVYISAFDSMEVHGLPPRAVPILYCDNSPRPYCLQDPANSRSAKV